MTDGNDILMGGGGAPSISFADPAMKGVWVSGTVLDWPKASQQTAPNGDLKTFDNGDPMMQAIIELNVQPPNGDDDGNRRLFAKGDMLRAIREAVLAAGGKGVEPRSQLAVRWSDDKPSKTKGNNPQKLYEGAYKLPPSTGNAALMGADPFGQPAAAPVVSTATGAPVVHQQTVPAPVATPPAAPAPAQQLTPAQYANPDPAPANVDPAMWASMDATQRAGLRQLLGLTGGPVQAEKAPF